MNDVQNHLLKKLGEAANEYRATTRALAAEVVDSILNGLEAGLTRDQMVDDLAAGFFQGGPAR